MGNIVDISEVLLDAGLSSSSTETERAMANAAIDRAEAAVRRFLGYDPVQRQRTEYYPQFDPLAGEREYIWEASSTHAYLRESTETGSAELLVRHLPIRSIASVHVDQNREFGASTAWTINQDYWLDAERLDDDGQKMGTVVRSAGTWPSSAGTVKLVYTSGYSAAEFHGRKDLVDATPILEAVVDEAVRRMLKVISRGKKSGAGWTGGPLTSESLGDYSYSTDASVLQKLVGSSADLMMETHAKLQPFVNYGYAVGG